MQTAHGNIHLEIQTSRKNPVGVLRTTFRENGKVKHAQHGRITGCSLNQLKLLQLAFREQVLAEDSPEALKILSAKEFGASAALLQLAKQLGLHKAIYSRAEPWVNDCLAMIVGRIIFAGSKLSLCHQHGNSCLWELCGVEDEPDVEDHCYEAMDRLLQRQTAIQKQLAKQHLSHGHLVLYDITSSYFEGEYADSDLVTFGYNRDGKKGHEQVVIGLVCTAEGCPIGVEVYPGNTKDSTTVIDKIHEIKTRYSIDQLIFVGDRGMVTKSNINALKDVEGLRTITALTHNAMAQLLNKNVIQRDLFNEQHVHEIIDPDDPHKRYCLCLNPARAQQETATRERLLTLTREGLTKIAAYKQSTTVEILGARIGKVLSKYKMGKFIEWEIKADQDKLSSCNHQVVWQLKEAKIAEEKRLDGCYIITTDVSADELKAAEVVASYRRLALVEQAFRNLKTVQLQVRPMYHKRDDRIRAHVFLCMLAYYLQWHMQQRLKPLLEADGKGKNRRWTIRFVIDTLRQITRNKVQMSGVTFFKNSELTEDQKNILQALNIKL